VRTREQYKLLVGQRVRQARERAGITQEELAARAGMDRTAVGKIERGERAVTVAALLRLAAALGTTGSSLLEGLR